MSQAPVVRVLLWLVLLASGCKESIALGTECPPIGETCRARTPRLTSDDDGDVKPLDAGSDARAAEPNDAMIGATPDASDSQVTLPIAEGGTAPSSLFPAIENPSLEITNNVSGGGVLSSLVVQATPWTGCSGPAFGPGVYPSADLRANFPIGAPTDAEKLAPSDGASLVNASPDGTAIAQTLGEPMRMGQRYAFMVDLASTTGATNLSLSVQGSTSSCLSAKPLAETAPANPGVWTSYCVTFTPEQDYSSIVLAATSAQPSTGTRLFIDNIRSDPSCD